MGRRGKLSDDEAQIIKKKITDDQAYEVFFKDRYLRNLRPATIEYYKNEFKAAKKIINKQLVDWEQGDVEEFIFSSKQFMKVTSINTRLRALRSFYNYLVKYKFIQNSPMSNIIETLSDRNIEKLIKVTRKKQSFVSFRDEVIMLVFLDTGVRLSELVGIETHDVLENSIIIRNTKDSFERTVYLS